MKPVELFKKYIVGDFDNHRQVVEELKQGKFDHPLAVHVGRDISHKIRNKPDIGDGFFLLEESYYLYENKALDLKPLFFLFTNEDDEHVRLTCYEWPQGVVPRNDNPNVDLDFNELKKFALFETCLYTLRDGSFYVDETVTPEDWSITLRERIGPDALEVMELFFKGGVRLTPYETPIIYERCV